MTLTLTSATGIRLVATLSVAYALSHFLRASLAVLAPELQAELGLSPEQLGLLSGMFFAVFAAVQIPVGIALDRFGPRLVLIVLSGFTVLGCLMFALGQGVVSLAAARAVMGMGCAAMLMGPYVIYAQAFPAARFAQVSSIQLGVGNLGVIIATAPLAWMTLAFGWRAVFAGAAVAAVIFAIATARVTRPIAIPTREHGLADDLRGVIEVLRIPGIVRLLPLNAAAYSSFASIVTLWAGPYLADIYGLGAAARGEVLFAVILAGIGGLFLFGPLDRWFNTRRGVVLAGTALSLVALIALTAVPDGPLPFTIACLMLLALGQASTVTLAAHNRALLPGHLIGRGVTISNMANMMGVAVLQVILGVVAGWGGGESVALDSGTYRALFAVVAVVLLAAAAVYATAEDVRPEPADAA